MSTTATGKPKRRHGARAHGTQIEKRAVRHKRQAGGFYAMADEFNAAFENVFCRDRPWLNRPAGWQFDPFLKPKTAP